MSSTIGRRRVKRIGEDSSALTSGGGGGGLAQGDRLVLPSGQPAVRCPTGDGRVFAKKKTGDGREGQLRLQGGRERQRLLCKQVIGAILQGGNLLQAISI
jgi:hypothetical protein